MFLFMVDPEDIRRRREHGTPEERRELNLIALFLRLMLIFVLIAFACSICGLFYISFLK